MTIRIVDVKVQGGSFSPEVTVSGLTLSVGAAPFKHGADSGSVDASTVTFQPGDVGKYLYVILVKRGATFSYDLRVQDPAVLTPIGVGVSEDAKELFAFLSGRVLDGDIELEVRRFTEAG